MNDILKRISGVVLIVIGIVVAIYTIVEPLLHVSSEEQMYGPLWDILNPLMVLAVVLGAIFSCIRASAREGLAAGRLRASTLPPTRCSTGSYSWASCYCGVGLTSSVLNTPQ